MRNMKSILIIEDDPAIAEGLKTTFEANHYNVRHESDGAEGFEAAKDISVDLIILDLMLPSMNGEDICSQLRQTGIGTPILMLTSKDQEMDKVLGLEIGADDYLTKPFSLRELQARVKALLRRSNTDNNAVAEEVRLGELYVNMKTQEVTIDSQRIELTAREFEILRFFIQHKNEVITRDKLLNEVWGYEHFPTTRTVDNYILSLRKKIEKDPANPARLRTIHTAGYKFFA
jgi:DNA-binding response OmpR family regulator